jgi:hypothetical protein
MKNSDVRKVKSRIELYQDQGPEAAWVLGLKLGLKQDTLRAWFGLWRRLSD